MKANIFKHEFNAHFRNILTWSVSLIALIAIFFSIFPSFADQAETMNELLANFPPQLLEAFGMNGLNLATVLGFYSFIFLFVQICLAIQAANYGVGLVSIEESELTADFLISKPVSRVEILNSKILAAFASLTITNAVVWVATFAALALIGAGYEYSAGTLTLLLGSIVLFQLFFLSVGLLISLLVKKVRSVTPYALGLGFGMYALSAFSTIGAVVPLELITPLNTLTPITSCCTARTTAGCCCWTWP